ncbi:MAG: hypothetical protein ACRCST_03075 [Turicibacter sp.]
MFNLDEKDIEFLKGLQNRLKTQETDYQALPRFWGVMETKRVYGINSDYDYTDKMLKCGDIDFYFSSDELEDAKESLVESDLCKHENILHILTIDELEEYMWDILNLETEWVYYRDEEVISQETGCFLTKEACKRHIELNHYHYNKPHTYAMTAWRNPEFEKLLNIINKLEFKEDLT